MINALQYKSHLMLMLALNSFWIEDIHMEEPKNPNKWLLDSRRENTDSANAAEETVSKQIILINSGALALVGGMVVNHTGTLDLSTKIFLTIAATMLITSFIAALIQLVLSHRLFLFVHRTLTDIISVAQHMPQTEFEKFYEKKLKELPSKSSTLPYWIELITFALGAIFLVLLIFTSIW